MTSTYGTIPVYCGSHGDTDYKIERESHGLVRVVVPASKPTYAFHIDDPKAAATLIEYLQPLADTVPKPREVYELGDDEKDAVWQVNMFPKERWMWSPLGWLNSPNQGANWRLSGVQENPKAPSQGFSEVLN